VFQDVGKASIMYYMGQGLWHLVWVGVLGKAVCLKRGAEACLTLQTHDITARM